ncbi:MAG: SRPBCC domain-containing protein [Planctomycetota bacterium]
MTTTKAEECRTVQYELEIEIAAAPERVWKAVTDELSSWWLPDFHMLGEDSTMVFEPWAGGRLLEENGAKGLLWYQVLAIDPPKMLALSGFTTPDFGGPATSLLTLKLEAAGSGTKLTVQDGLFGQVSEQSVKSLQAGWTHLFTDGLKAFIES